MDVSTCRAMKASSATMAGEARNMENGVWRTALLVHMMARSLLSGPVATPVFVHDILSHFNESGLGTIRQHVEMSNEASVCGIGYVQASRAQRILYDLIFGGPEHSTFVHSSSQRKGGIPGILRGSNSRCMVGPGRRQM